jgi:signal transduction histidine kinase/CheY-like chemotaxis protein
MNRLRSAPELAMGRPRDEVGVRARIERFLLAACAQPEDPECRRRVLMAHSFAFTGLVVTCWFLVAAVIAGEVVLAAVLGGVALLSIGCVVHLRWSKRYWPSTMVAMSGVAGLLLYLLATGGVRGTGAVWVFVYPPMSMFCLGRRWGSLWTGTFVLAAGLVLALPVGWLPVDYPATFSQRWFGALVFVTAVSVVSELLRDRAQRRLEREAEERRRAEQDAHAARRQAEQAAAVESRFLAAMSHELRTPLTGLLGLNRVLADGPLDERQRGLIDTIHRSGEHLLTIIDDVLDLSRLRAGMGEPTRRPFAPAALATEVCALFSAAARERGLTLALEIDPGCPAAVLGDAGRIRQVLDNLVGNAIKFTEVGRVELRIEATVEPDGRCSLRWEVSDTGVGIPPEQRARVFEEFQQGAPPERSPRGGVGLGLAISRRLVESMGGVLELDSRVGRGTRFWFSLCLPPAAAPVPVRTDRRRSQRKPAGAEAANAAAAQGARLLVAEDDPTNRLLLRLMLERLGARVDLVGDGREAIERSGRSDYDLIVMDCHMPQMDGFQATEAIRRQEARRGDRRTPILAVTANVTDENRVRCLQCGMDDCLFKPFEPNALERTIRRWLADRTRLDGRAAAT